MSITTQVAQLRADFGAYYIGDNNQANRQRLFQKLYVQTETDALFTRRQTKATTFQGALVKFDRIMQTYKKDWTSKDNVLEFDPLSIALRHLKFDVDINPNDDNLIESWASFLTGENKKEEDYPLIAYIIEEILLPTWAEEWELYAVYKGIYAPGAVNIANTSNDVIDGLRKQINDGITATTITPIALGALPASDTDLVRYFETFMDSVNPLHRNMSDTMMVSDEVALRFMRGMDELYNMNYAKESDLYKISKTNIKVKGLLSMTGSDKLILTPKSNRLLLEKDAKKISNVNIEPYRRNVSIFTDYWKGVGFLRHDILYTNDVDLL